jgi:hypothetical protein
VVKPVLGPWRKTLPDQGSDYEIMEDGNRAHCAAFTNMVRVELGIDKVLRPHLASTSMPWPPESPDLNPIENV